MSTFLGCASFIICFVTSMGQIIYYLTPAPDREMINTTNPPEAPQNMGGSPILMPPSGGWDEIIHEKWERTIFRRGSNSRVVNGSNHHFRPCDVTLWSEWSPWSQCSVSCGRYVTGVRLRRKYTISAVPNSFGMNCSETNPPWSESTRCFMGACPGEETTTQNSTNPTQQTICSASGGIQEIFPKYATCSMMTFDLICYMGYDIYVEEMFDNSNGNEMEGGDYGTGNWAWNNTGMPGNHSGMNYTTWSGNNTGIWYGNTTVDPAMQNYATWGWNANGNQTGMVGNWTIPWHMNNTQSQSWYNTTGVPYMNSTDGYNSSVVRLICMGGMMSARDYSTDTVILVTLNSEMGPAAIYVDDVVGSLTASIHLKCRDDDYLMVDWTNAVSYIRSVFSQPFPNRENYHKYWVTGVCCASYSSPFCRQPIVDTNGNMTSIF